MTFVNFRMADLVIFPSLGVRSIGARMRAPPKPKGGSNEESRARHYRRQPAGRRRSIARRRAVQGQARQVHQVPAQAQGLPRRQGPFQEVLTGPPVGTLRGS